jgi:phage-related protein
MSDMTYSFFDGHLLGQAARVASWRDQDTALFTKSARGGRVLIEAGATGSPAGASSLQTDAGDWKSLHELRVEDQNQIWRIIYRIDPDAIIIAEVFSKKTKKTPPAVITVSQQRLKAYDDLNRGGRRR